MSATFHWVLLSATAGPKYLAGTRFGTTACRVGVSTAVPTANSPAATSSVCGATRRSTVSTVSPIDIEQVPIWTAINSLRRSKASASMPPKMASAICGMARQRPNRPTWSAELVSSYICQAMATVVNWEPI